MDPKKLKKFQKSGPEKEIEQKLMAYLREKKWFVFKTHGNEFQQGLPDLYCAHYEFHTRWIEVKNPLHYHFTPAQLEIFPQMQSKGVGIWILTAYDDYEYQKLFQPPNWYRFLGRSSYSRIG